MLTSLTYHDVLSAQLRGSGFGSAAASSYKLEVDMFEAHLAALGPALSNQPVSGLDSDSLGAAAHTPERQILLTFDDGGASSVHPTADLLEAHGVKGLFFIATDYVGTEGFLSNADICALHRRGHGIGTHSASHPLRMAALTPTELDTEWRTSMQRIGELLGQEIAIASVPGGHYGRNVAESAQRCGIRLLFTSEPVSRVSRVGDCLVLGRYSVKRTTSSQEVRALASGNPAAILRQRLSWDAKKLLKRLGGRSWLALRARYYDSRSKR